jgi:hypothetical protein
MPNRHCPGKLPRRRRTKLSTWPTRILRLRLRRPRRISRTRARRHKSPTDPPATWTSTTRTGRASWGEQPTSLAQPRTCWARCGMAPTTIRGRGRVVSTSEERVWDDAEGSWLEMAEAEAVVNGQMRRCGDAVGGVAVGSGVGVGAACCANVVGWRLGTVTSQQTCIGSVVVVAVVVVVTSIISSSRASCILSDKLKCTCTHLSLFSVSVPPLPSSPSPRSLLSPLTARHLDLLFLAGERPRRRGRYRSSSISSGGRIHHNNMVRLDDQSCNHSRSHSRSHRRGTIVELDSCTAETHKGGDDCEHSSRRHARSLKKILC